LAPDGHGVYQSGQVERSVRGFVAKALRITHPAAREESGMFEF
jgi:hypothetical protein